MSLQQYVRDMRYSVRQKIADKLDVEDEVNGNDCRKLAALVGMPNDKIKLIWKGRGGGSAKPTEHVLNTWGTKNAATIERLREFFVEMEHDDLVEILDNEYPGLAGNGQRNNNQLGAGADLPDYVMDEH